MTRMYPTGYVTERVHKGPGVGPAGPASSGPLADLLERREVLGDGGGVLSELLLGHRPPAQREHDLARGVVEGHHPQRVEHGFAAREGDRVVHDPVDVLGDEADQHPSHRRVHRPLGDLALHLAAGEAPGPARQVPRIGGEGVHLAPGAVDDDVEMTGAAGGGDGRVGLGGPVGGLLALVHGREPNRPAGHAAAPSETLAGALGRAVVRRTASFHAVGASPSCKVSTPGRSTHGAYQSSEIPDSSRAKVLTPLRARTDQRGIRHGRRGRRRVSAETAQISSCWVRAGADGACRTASPSPCAVSRSPWRAAWSIARARSGTKVRVCGASGAPNTIGRRPARIGSITIAQATEAPVPIVVGPTRSEAMMLSVRAGWARRWESSAIRTAPLASSGEGAAPSARSRAAPWKPYIDSGNTTGMPRSAAASSTASSRGGRSRAHCRASHGAWKQAWIASAPSSASARMAGSRTSPATRRRPG